MPLTVRTQATCWPTSCQARHPCFRQHLAAGAVYRHVKHGLTQIKMSSTHHAHIGCTSCHLTADSKLLLVMQRTTWMPRSSISFNVRKRASKQPIVT